MNCQLCQQELSDRFGSTGLSEEITDHLSACPDCRKLWDEMNQLSERLGANSDFTPNDDRLDQMVAFVERDINLVARRDSHSSLRRRLLAIAASAVLMFGVASISYRLGSISDDLTKPGLANSNRLGIDVTDEEETLDETTISILLDDYILETGYEAGELLLEDITDEEFDYLKKNLDVGGML